MDTVYQTLDIPRPFDYFAIHPYFHPESEMSLNPQVYFYDPEHMVPGDTTILDKFITTMASNQDPNKRIWITEIGWNSAQDDPGGECLSEITVTENEQAVYLKNSFDIIRSQAPRVDKIIWYQFVDTTGSYCTPDAFSAPFMFKSMAPENQSLINAPASEDPWFFGLYHLSQQGVNAFSAKPSLCVFAAYPSAAKCLRVFLPLIRR